MKTGRTLPSLAAELQRQHDSKLDLMVSSSLMSCETDSAGVCALTIDAPDELQSYRISEIAQRQISDKLKIPWAYFERMRDEQPALLDRNINTWLHVPDTKNRLIRILDGRVRAFLSENYRLIDHFELAEFILPVLMDLPEAEFASIELTETRMYLKAITPRVSFEVAPGDVVYAGVTVSNSEVGWGHLSVEPLIYRLVCKNGLICADAGLRKKHLGRQLSTDDGIGIVYKDDTLMAEDQALLLKVRDMVESAVSEVTFQLAAQKLQRTLGINLAADPVKAVNVVAHRFAFNERERSGILRSLINGSDLSGYGLVNAVTGFSQQIADYDRATELEAVGGKMLEMSTSEWNEIAEAA
ncbi:DUF932 domain-containing protein [Duganella sp. FT92W]|uniref:DUF932 domain-containing protein n=1 Tax=Pseudoduganella rivuli TaxID=2666085 RepID=A0A7X2LPR1_9BURK|nr:DUF932 domain-containing protein [Pseudoduganella rivuli]MRV70560.1 DUF932 domain-containing protein [Pseudoduganella rivuli]